MALGHGRLAIIDLREIAQQPMTNEDGNVVIVVNGEIYNHRELRADLEQRGHVFRSNSDSEVVAHLWEEHGEQTPAMLRGMFALAVWDKRERVLLLARDRYGEKPLCWAMTKHGLVFASELRALIASGLVPTELDPAALDAYLALQYVPHPRTIYDDIHKLPPGHQIVVRPGRDARAGAVHDGRLHAGPRHRRARVRRRDPPHRRGCREGPPDVGRAARGLPVGWDRFVDRGRVHGARGGRAREDVLDRLRRARSQRAAVRAPDRRALRHRSPRGDRRAGHDRAAAEDRAPVRRAVRRPERAAHVDPRRDDEAPRHGRALGRRRRRVVRRLQALRLVARRAPDRPAAGAGEAARGRRASCNTRRRARAAGCASTAPRSTPTRPRATCATSRTSRRRRRRTCIRATCARSSPTTGPPSGSPASSPARAAATRCRS